MMERHHRQLRAIIIDDEKNSRRAVRLALERACPEVVIITDADSVTTGRDAIERHQPDLVFLDVEMNAQTGFDLLDAFAGRTFSVIFISAHTQYHARAVTYSAVDYLLKPVDLTELRAAVEKAIAAREST